MHVEATTAVVCDDDLVACQVIAAMLRTRGFDVLAQVHNAILALDLVRSRHPDVLVLDLALPGLGGLEILPDIQSISPDTRVILVSAFEMTREDARSRGAVDVIDKTDLERLDTVLETLAEVTAHD